MKTTYNLPANWAPYLINGDSSKLSRSEIVLCDRTTKNYGHCVAVSEDRFLGRVDGVRYTLAEYSFVK